MAQRQVCSYGRMPNRQMHNVAAVRFVGGLQNNVPPPIRAAVHPIHRTAYIYSYGLYSYAYIVTAYMVMAYYLRSETEFAGALHVSAIWDLHYQNC